jgi:hypothetical protein
MQLLLWSNAVITSKPTAKANGRENKIRQTLTAKPNRQMKEWRK